MRSKKTNVNDKLDNISQNY